MVLIMQECIIAPNRIAKIEEKGKKNENELHIEQLE